MPLSPAPVGVSVIDLFPPLRRHLVDLLAGLSGADWQRPTANPGWSVKDTALHLLGGDFANLSRRRDGLTDALTAYAPPGTDLSAAGALVPVLNAWNEDWVIAARRISPRLLGELLVVTGEAQDAYYRGLDLTATGSAVSWVGPDPAPVWLDIAREYTEQWMHQAQIRDAVGVPGIHTPRFFAPVIATFIHALPRALRAVTAPDGTCLNVIVTGAAGGAWYAARAAGAWTLHTGTAQGAATVTLAAEDAWRLWTKALSPDAAARAITATGDARLTAAVGEMVAFIG